VVYRRLCLELAAASGGHDTLHAGAASFLVVTTVAVSRGFDPLKTFWHLFLLPLAPSLMFSMMMSDGTPLSLIGVASLLPGEGRQFSNLVAGGVLGGSVT
jgi:hypothetical protein